MTHSSGRVGGMAAPPTPHFKPMVREALPAVLKLVGESERLLVRNRIFLDRSENVGRMSYALWRAGAAVGTSL